MAQPAFAQSKDYPPAAEAGDAPAYSRLHWVVAHVSPPRSASSSAPDATLRQSVRSDGRSAASLPSAGASYLAMKAAGSLACAINSRRVCTDRNFVKPTSDRTASSL